MKKKVLLIALFMLLLTSLLYAEIQRPNLKPMASFPFATRPNLPSRNAPNVECVTAPVPLMENYYDYFPGSYNRTPMIVLPEYSENGNPLGGVSIGFQARETPSSNRRIYNAQISPLGEIIYLNAISNQDVWEGFPSTIVDPISAQTFIAYHTHSEYSNLNIYMTYHHDFLLPYSWKVPFSVFGNAQFFSYLWPKVAVGKSPIENHRRIFVLGEATPLYGEITYTTIVAKSDFDNNTLNSLEDLNFTTIQMPELWNQNLRINKDIAVSDDGKVAIVGWYDTTFFMLYSADFGETFTYLEANGRFELPSPMLPDGSYMFVDSNGTPSEIFAYPSGDGGHFNAFFNDNNQIIAFSAMGINTQENYDSGFYFPAYFYPKIYQFEIENNNLNVHVVDLHLEGAFPNDGIPVIPWDLNNDGIIDEVDENGAAIIPLAYPSHYFDGDFQNAFFHESNFRLTYNNNWAIAVWQDCEKVAMNYNEVPGYEGWEEKPEIMVAVSADYGITWSQPAYLNAKEGDENYFPELYAMTPAYVYPADKLEVIDSNHAKLHLFFMDDYSYGSFIQGNGGNLGGMLYYSALSVEMPNSWVFDNHAPYVANPLENFSMDEDTVNQAINLTTVFNDPDFMYGDALTYSFSNDINIDVQMNQTTGIVTLTPSLNWFGEETIRFTATDLAGLSVTEEVTVTVVNVYDPPVIINPLDSHFLITSVQEEVIVDFFGHFFHPDGIPLIYTAEYNEEQISVTLFTDGMILGSAGNWIGCTGVTVIASDGIDLKTSVEKNFLVTIHFDLPVISFSTNTLLFDTAYLNEDSEIKEITIQNIGNTTLFIEQITAPVDFYIKLSNQTTWSEFLSSFVLNVYDEIILEVKLKPSEQKQYNETMEIHSNAGNEPIHQIQLTAKSENPFPNAFTPNGDGINDEFTIKINSTENVPLKLIIYNSKSRKIKEISGNSSQPISWNGKDSNNNDCNSTHYLYVLHKDGSVYKRGIIYLIR